MGLGGYPNQGLNYDQNKYRTSQCVRHIQLYENRACARANTVNTRVQTFRDWRNPLLTSSCSYDHDTMDNNTLLVDEMSVLVS
jgi:hypothetical protein